MEDNVSRRHLIHLGAGIALTGISGCIGSPFSDGHDHSHGDGENNSGHGGAIGEPVDNAEVTMITTSDDEYHFSPHVVRVVPGGTVTFKLESGTHSTTAYASKNGKPRRIPDGATAWDSGTMSKQGSTFEHTFETEGVYDYYCIPHESVGMIGSIVVGDPQLDDQPGMAEPQSALSDSAKSKIRDLNERVANSLE